MVANMSMARSAGLAIGGRRTGRRSVSPEQPTLWDVRGPSFPVPPPLVGGGKGEGSRAAARMTRLAHPRLRVLGEVGTNDSGSKPPGTPPPPNPLPPLRPELRREEGRKKEDLRLLLETLHRPAARACALGVPALDAALPEGGLALGRMHEIVAADGEAGTGFAALLLARIAGRTGRVLWCGPQAQASAAYGPGLEAFGLDPDRVIFARTAAGEETLWAMEEGLRCRALSAVLGETPIVDLTAGRRLQLAAERGGVTALVLRRAGQRRGQVRLDPSAATTRWRVAARPRRPDERDHGASWQVGLLRCRGGTPRDFQVDWCHATGDLAVAAAAGDGPAAPGRLEPVVAPPQADAAD